jgi:hypothetical protein
MKLETTARAAIMNWQEAKDSTIAVWENILGSIGTAEPLDLLIEINAISDLCELANLEVEGAIGRCRYCPAYQQFGGCREVSGWMSEMVAEKDWEGLRSMVGRFLAQLRAMEAESAVSCCEVH